MTRDDAAIVARAWRRSVVQTAAGMTAVLMVVGVVALVLVDRNRSASLDLELAAVLAAADDVGDPPPGSYLARIGPDGVVEVTVGAPGPVVALLTTAVTGPAAESRDVGLPGTGGYRVRALDRADGQRWVIADDLATLRADQGLVLQAVGLAEAGGVLGTLLAAALLSRRSVRPLARALELQRRFVADASHELRAPLTVLHTRAQILATDPAAHGDGALGRGLRGLVDDTRALGEVVEDLLLSAELDRSPRSREQVDLDAVVASVVESMAGHARSRGVALTHAAPDGPHRVLGHRTALRRAVTALIDNAVGHTPEHGHVHVEVTPAEHGVRVVVADDGVGLDPATAEELFARSHHGDDGHGLRFGLGLALVRDVARAHGGTVTADGVPGAGACFTLALPDHRMW